MTTEEALFEIRSTHDREWLRYDGKDYLAEYEAKRIIKAARHLADVIDGANIGKPI